MNLARHKPAIRFRVQCKRIARMNFSKYRFIICRYILSHALRRKFSREEIFRMLRQNRAALVDLFSKVNRPKPAKSMTFQRLLLDF